MEIKIKTECSTYEEVRRTLSFMARCSQGFYLDLAEEINSKHLAIPVDHRNNHKQSG